MKLNVTAFPGAYETRVARAWVKPPVEPMTRTVSIPEQCKTVFASVVLNRKSDGDWVVTVRYVGRGGFTAGMRSGYFVDGRYSETAEAKLRAACDAYYQSQSGVRGTINTVLDMIYEGLGIPRDVKIVPPDKAMGTRG